MYGMITGGIRTIPRVTAGEGYPCQMQKNQTFSCLFRHYAKVEHKLFYLTPDDSFYSNKRRVAQWLKERGLGILFRE